MAVAQTTLAAAIATTNATTATVRDVLGFASSSETDDLVLIDSEYMLVAGGLGTTSWSSITRGYAGSTAATHSDGATVTRIERGWTDLVRVKRALGITDVDDDQLLLDYIEDTNAEVTLRVGLFLGPSTDTVRVYDGCKATNSGRRLHVPGGIRTLTQVRIASTTGGSFATMTLADYLLRPLSHELRPGQPYPWIDVAPDAAPIPAAYGNVELTGTFQPATVQRTGGAVATMVVCRMYNARDAGHLANPTPSKFIFPDDAATLRSLAAEHFPKVA